MTAEEAIDECGFLKTMFPGTQQDALDFWFKNFQRFPQQLVHSAIELHAGKHGDFADRPKLLAEIEGFSKTPGANAAAAHEQAEAVARQRQRDIELVQASWRDIDRMIAEFTDEDLADLKAEVIRNAAQDNDPLARLLEKRDPRTSRILQTKIYAHMRSAGKVGAA